jgi:hypothetical protein
MEILPLLFMKAAIVVHESSSVEMEHMYHKMQNTSKGAEDGNPVIVVHASSSVEMEHMYHKMQNTSR